MRGVDAILNETQRAGRRSKGLEVQKIYPRLAANGARVATREAREGQKLHILPFFSKSRVLILVTHGLYYPRVSLSRTS